MLWHSTQEQHNKTKTEQNKNKLELLWLLRPMWTQIFGDVKIWYTGKYFFLSVTQNKTRFSTICYEELFMCSFFLIIRQQVTDYSIILCPIVLGSAACFICVVNNFFYISFIGHFKYRYCSEANINSNKLYWLMYWGSRPFKASEKLKAKASS